jgi:acetoin utilization protein AcuB
MPQNQNIGLTVGDIMSRPPLTVSADSDLREARYRLREYRVHHLFVEDRGRIVGLLSDRDVLRAVSPYADGISSQRRDDETLNRPVYSVASYDMITVGRDTTVEVAAATMLEHDISCLPVTGPSEEILGMVTTRDLLRATLSCLISAQPAEDQAA